MGCMKCGREIDSDQVFCQECLAEMENYPVKPDVVVLLPRNSQNQPKKPASHRRHPILSPEEQIQQLKKRVVALTVALALSVAATLGLAYLTVADYLKEKDVQFLPGQNYSSSNSTTDGR